MAAVKQKEKVIKHISMVNDTNKRLWIFKGDPIYKELAIDINDGPEMNKDDQWCIDGIFTGQIHAKNIYLEPIGHIMSQNRFYEINEFVIDNSGNSSTWSRNFITWYKNKCDIYPAPDIEYEPSEIIYEKAKYYHIQNVATGDQLLYFKTEDDRYRKCLSLYFGRQINVEQSKNSYEIVYTSDKIYEFTEEMETTAVTTIEDDATHAIIDILGHVRATEYNKEVKTAMKGSTKDLTAAKVGKSLYKFYTTLQHHTFSNYLIVNAEQNDFEIPKKKGIYKWSMTGADPVDAIFGGSYFSKDSTLGLVYVYGRKFVFNSRNNRLHCKGYIVQDLSGGYTKGMDIIPKKDLEPDDRSDSESDLKED